MKYVGTQWYKCDFHLHTTASKCFADQAVTAEEWVLKAVEAGLDCVAVTDHNSASMIDEIKVEAIKKDLTVFPGVEITCDTSKIHLLVLFDADCSAQNVEDFLVQSGINRNDFGEQDAYTTKSIFDIIEISKDNNSIVIPAHIDEFNGLSSLSKACLKILKSNHLVNGYQVANPFLYDKALTEEEKFALIESKYGNDTVSDDLFKKWMSTGVEFFDSKECALLTFSDNPENPKSSQHGIDGIGTNYTWIKMDEKPSLEGIRQALLTPQFRVKNCYESNASPFVEPAIWFKSIEIKGSHLNKSGQPLLVDFNPQMNTIIGGRGSGKSSILRFIRGLFNKDVELTALEDIYKEHEGFYKVFSKRDGKGVLKSGTSITVEIIRHGVLYNIYADGISNSLIQNVIVYKVINGIKQLVDDSHFIEFFTFDQYSQKQIYEISKNTNTLRLYIDRAIDDVKDIDSELANLEGHYLKTSRDIKYISDLVETKEKLVSEENDLVEQLKMLESGDIKTLLEEKKLLSEEVSSLRLYSKSFNENKQSFSKFIAGISAPSIEIPDNQRTPEIVKIVKDSTDGWNKQMDIIKAAVISMETIETEMSEAIKASQLLKSVESNKQKIKELSQKLNIDTDEIIEKFESLETNRDVLKSRISDISKSEAKLPALADELHKVKEAYVNTMTQRMEKRKGFLQEYVVDEKIQIIVKQYRDKAGFTSKFR